MKLFNEKGMLVALALVGLLGFGAGDALAQDRTVSFETRAGVNVPTFDIADVAEAGPSFGAGVTVPVADRISVLADADFGFHNGKNGGPDVNVFHYMGKVAFDVLERNRGPWTFRVNAGAGAMTFDVDAPGLDAQTYFAINVGAKIGYDVNERLNVFISPQGDIAFSDEDEVGTDNAWVWPFAAGLQFNF